MKIVKDEVLGTWAMAESDQNVSHHRRVAGLEPPDKRRILIVDDELAVRTVFKRIFDAELPDYTIDSAKNGEEAVALFEEYHYCLIVMDLSMPKMDGEEAFYKIIESCVDKKWIEPSVVFCTGYDPPSTLRQLIAETPSHCMLHKPVSSKLFMDVIKKRL